MSYNKAAYKPGYCDGQPCIEDCKVCKAIARHAITQWSRQGQLTDLYINDSGHIRRIGDNPHDQLTIDDEGRLHYYNLQNGDGCTLGEKREHDECFYEFVVNEDDYGYNYDPREQ